MKKRTILFGLATMFVFVAVCFAADDANMGTWKLDQAKSKLTAGTPKNTSVVYQAAGDSVKVIVDGVGTDGKATHNEWTGKFDGKDYPVTGDPTADSRSYKKVDDHTLALSNKKDGKVTLSGTAKVSADGKTRTVTLTGKAADGKKITGTAVYNKE